MCFSVQQTRLSLGDLTIGLLDIGNGTVSVSPPLAMAFERDLLGQFPLSFLLSTDTGLCRVLSD